MPLALTLCVALDKSLDLSEPSFLLFYRVESHGVEIRNNIQGNYKVTIALPET